MSKTGKLHKNWKWVEAHTTWISGPETVDFQSNDVIVVARVRNAEAYIQPFVQHYLQLGVKHLFFLDNHSTDNTLKEASQFEQVTLYQTQLPYKEYKMDFIHFLLNKFGQHCWSLVVDIDEFFDYPFSKIIPLSALIQYLNSNNFQAVIGQMLDMFPANLSLASLQNSAQDFPKEHNCYDLSNISKHLYHEVIQNNEWTNFNINIHRGGIRKSWFGLTDIVLSKFSLVRYSSDWHWESIHRLFPCKVADFSGVIYHYKFRSDFVQYVQEAVKEEQYNHHSFAYKQMLEAIQNNHFSKTSTKSVQKQPDTIELVRQNFLAVSEAYFQMARTQLLDYKTKAAPEKLKQLWQYQNRLLELAIQKTSAVAQELSNIREGQLMELKREIGKIKNSWSWKIGNAIVKPIKKWAKWLK